MFTVASFTIAKLWNQPMCLLMDKENVTMNIIQLLKMMQILPFVMTWINLRGIMVSEIRHTEKDKYRMVSLVCEIKIKKEEVKLIDTKSKMVVARSLAVGEIGRLIMGKNF